MQRFVWHADTAAHTAVEIATLLKGGAIGVLPTETVYGLVCAHGHETALSRLYAAKGRGHDQKCQILIGTPADAEAFSLQAPGPVVAIGEAFWPGPLTLVCDSAYGTVGLRCPDHSFVQAVIAELGTPLVATSANPAGVSPTESLAAEFADLPGLDFVVRSSQPLTRRASTVAKLHAGELTILREGAIALNALQRSLLQHG
ncbi:MAG TPA: hypothetical protein DCR55_01245 [Lentisphaeria bacterium]|jgi:tRNA threonylcarbamoyl adenosine modification protein (Sua5/YciO/YrdC/YwlC family)|nr:hypothetical protein [Lentisphaeria bacterium]